MNLIRQRFCSLRAACGDPRDRCPVPDGGPLSAVRAGIGPSSSKSSTAQTATNQQVAVSGGGTATSNAVSLSNTGAGSSAQINSPGATSITLGSKANLAINDSTTKTVNSNNRLTNSNNTTTTINNSGTSNYSTYNGASDAVVTAAINAVTNLGSQFTEAIGGLADTVTHATTTTPGATSAAAPVVYVTTPAAASTTSDQTPNYIESTGTTGGIGLTNGEILLILAAVAVIGTMMIWHANKK
jgi:hypothetical protein